MKNLSDIAPKRVSVSIETLLLWVKALEEWMDDTAASLENYGVEIDRASDVSQFNRVVAEMFACAQGTVR